MAYIDPTGSFVGAKQNQIDIVHQMQRSRVGVWLNLEASQLSRHRLQGTRDTKPLTAGRVQLKPAPSWLNANIAVTAERYVLSAV
jgi:hypothetical protein